MKEEMARSTHWVQGGFLEEVTLQLGCEGWVEVIRQTGNGERVACMRVPGEKVAKS